jgi:hypothetical protein
MTRRSRPDSVLFATGKRGSGKSSFLKQYARGFGRVLVWDPKNEYGAALGVDPIRSPSELVARIAEPLLVFVPPKGIKRKRLVAVFDFVCECVAARRHRSLFLVDELAGVSSSHGGSGWWDYLEREGRHDGIELAAAAQRPVRIDPQLIANATRIVVFRLGRKVDRVLMAEELDIELDQLRLPQLHFLDFDLESEEITRGRIVFAK